MNEDERARREWRKFGTDRPHEPTDEFVIHAFAEGARSLWPDSRDPGWHTTFQRWLAARDARVAALPMPPSREEETTTTPEEASQG